MTENDRPVLLCNAKIYTFDNDGTIADAILIANGRVVAVGSYADLEPRAGKHAEKRDLRGAVALPGLVDTHPHLLHFAARQAPLVDIADARNHGEIVDRIAQRAKTTPEGKWIQTTPVGEPWYFIRRSYRDLEERALPTRHVLDRASDRHPIAIMSWEPNIPNVVAFNSMALGQLGITKSTPDRVAGVSIEKDGDGQPTGRLSGAVNSVFSGDEFAYQMWRKVPLPSFELVKPATRKAIAEHHRLGVTAIYENHLMQRRQIDVYRGLRDAGDLNLRVATAQEADAFGTAWVQSSGLDDFKRALESAALTIESTDDYFRFTGFSVQWDGGIYPGQMMMRQPYLGPDGRDATGAYMVPPERIEIAMRFCAQRKIRLNIVCIGTRAHDENLQILESLHSEYDLRALHWILVHTPFIEEEQIRRYRNLGFDVTTTMTYLFGTGDLYRKRFKPEFRDRMLGNLLPLRRFLDAGMVLTGGRDWGPNSVFEQIQLALTHRTPGGFSNLGEAQRINRYEAVSMWTRNAGKLLQWDGIGSLHPGSYADLVITDRDPMACNVEEIGETRVLETMFDGRVVHNSE